MSPAHTVQTAVTLGRHAHGSGSGAHHRLHRAHADLEGHAGHDRHAGHSVEMFRRKFWGTLLLSIACPHALGLAIPLVGAISTALGARSGLLVRDRRGLEEARNVIAVSSTRPAPTRGEFRVVETTARDGTSPDETLALAAAVERDSEHTSARGIVKSAEERRAVAIPERGSGSEALPGARCARRPWAIGSSCSAVPHSSAASARRWTRVPGGGRSRGRARPGRDHHRWRGVTSLAVFAVADAVREESREAVQRLHEQGIEVIMMAGDVRPVANAVAADLGILGFLGAASVRVWPIMSRGRGPSDGGDRRPGGC